MTTLGLSIMARDEETELPHLLASIAPGAFDQVALLDTGSVDSTVDVFCSWARGQELSAGWRVGRFTWCDDFAAARNAAAELLSTDWISWADADNVIDGSERLRTIAECTRPEVDALQFDYDYYALGAAVVVRCFLWRRGRGRWVGRLHERLDVAGEVDWRPPDWAEWIHRGRPASDGSARNLAIARRWAREEPDSPEALAVLAGEEELALGCVHNANAPAAQQRPGAGTGDRSSHAHSA